MKSLSSRALDEYRRATVAEYQRRDDEAFRLRARIADLEREVAQMATRLRRAEAQSAAFRASVESLAALIASVGLATGK